MTAQRYVHDILQPHLLPLMQRLLGAIFQQDNARPHMARVSQDCLRTVSTLSWPARSPDLSPIEHIWDHLGCIGQVTRMTPGSSGTSLSRLPHHDFVRTLTLNRFNLYHSSSTLWVLPRLSPMTQYHQSHVRDHDPSSIVVTLHRHTFPTVQRSFFEVTRSAPP
ncbi:transposable element Tcb1 transposase [Trichonephila clavipes]|nr:transposable element Tcb1 transposase [Trichonephila clavipes]